eukprot:PhM_4_TR6206/c0_g1_i1/m.78989/K15335/NSUN2; tRNA (cytosine34-C5)-methyltransferase
MGRFKKRTRKDDVWLNDVDDNAFKNELLEKYYRHALPWTGGDDEFAVFMESLRAPLPSSTRLSVTDPIHAERVRAIFQSAMTTTAAADAPTVRSVSLFEGMVPSPRVEAWDVDLPRKQLKKHEHVKALHNNMVLETSMGIVSRQEIVSMLPVCFLDVQPHHHVLDMCAAPGSKTAQIVEKMTSTDGRGFVIANDVDVRRLDVLVKQTQRLRDVASHLLVTHHCATAYPLDYRFDRILCDVMCSGDGTLRKSPDLWSRWRPNDGPNMHRQQKLVLERAFRVLKPGGRIVYSTCSMNPIEDEATIAAALIQSKGAVRLVDVRDQMPNFKYTPGITTWRMMDNAGNWYDKFDDAPEELRQRLKWSRSMFPPEGVDLATLNMERCMRVLPHLQNTGGFFVAVLEKVDTGEVLPTPTPSANAKSYDIFQQLDETVEKKIRSTYDITDDNVAFPFERLVQRIESKKTTKVYMTVKDAAPLITVRPQRLEIAHVGVRVFETPRREVQPIRLTQDGAAILAPYLPEGKVMFRVAPTDFLAALQCPKIDASSSISALVPILSDAAKQVVVLRTTTSEKIELFLVLHRMLIAASSFWAADLEDVERNWMLARLGVTASPVDGAHDDDDEKEKGESDDGNDREAPGKKA